MTRIDNVNKFEVSVIVPVHNVAPYLVRCIDSLLSQKMQVEIILVENGSTDDTLSICKDYEKKYSNIKVVVNSKCGLPEARNFGKKFATGNYVGFIDGDDYVDSEMYMALYNAIISTDADMSSCNFTLVHSDGSIKEDVNTGTLTIVDPVKACENIILGKSTSSSCVRLFKRRFIMDREFPESRFYEDHAVLYRWVYQSNKVAHIDKGYYYYCLREGSITQSGCNPVKKMDLLTAELGRYKFVTNSSKFPGHVKSKLCRRIMHDAIFVLKSYVYYYGGDEKEYGHVMELREKLLNGVPVTMAQVGFGTWLRLKRIRYGWESYYKHLVKKSR